MPLGLLDGGRGTVGNRTEPAKTVGSEVVGSGLRCIDFDRELCKGANHHPNLGYPPCQECLRTRIGERGKALKAIAKNC